MPSKIISTRYLHIKYMNLILSRPMPPTLANQQRDKARELRHIIDAIYVEGLVFLNEKTSV